MNKNIVIVIIFSVFIGAGIAFITYSNENNSYFNNQGGFDVSLPDIKVDYPSDIKNGSPVVCTADAKQCSDGSYVSRIAPNCQFAECPSVAFPVLDKNDKEIPENCIMYYDGCNNCSVEDGKLIICTERYCEKFEYEEAKCTEYSYGKIE